MIINEALNAWMDTQPKKYSYPNGLHVHGKNGKSYKIPARIDGDCECIGGSSNHYKQTRHLSGKLEIISSVPREDKNVCPRERAWRYYISLRDGKNHCVV